jgi:hypothetical protein
MAYLKGMLLQPYKFTMIEIGDFVGAVPVFFARRDSAGLQQQKISLNSSGEVTLFLLNF